MLSLLWEFYLKSFLPSPLLFVFNRPMRLYHPGSFSTMGKLGWKEFHWATPWSAGSVRHRLRLLCLSNNVGSGAETTSLSTELHLLRGWDNAGEIKLLFFLISRGVVLALCSCVVLEVPTWIPDSLPVIVVLLIVPSLPTRPHCRHPEPSCPHLIALDLLRSLCLPRLSLHLSNRLSDSFLKF